MSALRKRKEGELYIWDANPLLDLLVLCEEDCGMRKVKQGKYILLDGGGMAAEKQEISWKTSYKSEKNQTRDVAEIVKVVQKQVKSSGTHWGPP